MRRLLAAFILVALAVGLAPLWSGEPDVVIERNIIYSKAGGEDLALDLAVPKAGGPFPMIVSLHGGGWRGGSRQDLGKFIDLLAKKGFAAATVSYRFAPKHRFPAQIEDCKAAVRWLRANVAKYKLDPDRFGAVGFSAGGHLSCLLGAADKDAGLEGIGGNEKTSSRVQAVVSYFGPTDFIEVTWNKAVEDTFLVPFLGGTPTEVPEQYRRSSPIIYASADDPPFLFFHGTEDKLVGIANSQKMVKKLEEAGVSASLVTMQGDGHGWGGAKLQQTLDQTIAFFEEKLKK